jgi:hypothetical protein
MDETATATTDRLLRENSTLRARVALLETVVGLYELYFDSLEPDDLRDALAALREVK